MNLDKLTARGALTIVIMIVVISAILAGFVDRVL